MIKKILILLLFCTSLEYSQSDNFRNDYILKFSMLDLFTGFQYQSSTIQFGVEKGISSDMSIYTEVGYLFHLYKKPDLLIINFKNSSGFAIETEVRKYIGEEKSKFIGQYFSIDFLYRYVDGKDEQWVSDNRKEGYSIFRNEGAIHIKYGYQNISLAGFVSDFSIGLGLRNISSKTDSKYPLSMLEYEFPYNKPFETGSRTFISATAAIRIGWSIK